MTLTNGEQTSQARLQLQHDACTSKREIIVLRVYMILLCIMNIHGMMAYSAQPEVECETDNIIDKFMLSFLVFRTDLCFLLPHSNQATSSNGALRLCIPNSHQICAVSDKG
jgi:hypothetical protein